MLNTQSVCSNYDKLLNLNRKIPMPNCKCEQPQMPYKTSSAPVSLNARSR